MSANANVLKSLECPVCIEYMIDEIHQCPIGHSVCNKCILLLNNCPTCKTRLHSRTIRNFALEAVSQNLTAECPEEGCQVRSTLSYLRTHEKMCMYREQKCRLGCEWKGTKSKLLEHAQKEHSMAVVQNTFLFILRKFQYCDTVKLAQVSGKLFYFHQIIKDDTINWVLQCLEEDGAEKKFSYKITIIYLGTWSLSSSAICQSELQTIDEIIDKGACVFLPIALLDKYSGNNNAKIQVDIIPIGNNGDVLTGLVLDALPHYSYVY